MFKALFRYPSVLARHCEGPASNDREHLPRYLAEFASRFNRRYNLASMSERLGFAAANTPPSLYRFAIMAESHW